MTLPRPRYFSLAAVPAGFSPGRNGVQFWRHISWPATSSMPSGQNKPKVDFDEKPLTHHMPFDFEGRGDSKPNTPEPSAAEAESRRPLDLRAALVEKTADTLERLIDEQVDRYFQGLVKRDILKADADRLFTMLKEGKSGVEVLGKLRELASAIVEKSLR